jgi:Ferric reductase like transmembrane component
MKVTQANVRERDGDNGGRMLLVDPRTSPHLKTGWNLRDNVEVKRSFAFLRSGSQSLLQHFWIGLYLTATVAAFTSQATKYASNEEAQNLLGTSVVISRGAAQRLNLNCALILLPVSRSSMTRLNVSSSRVMAAMPPMADTQKWIGFAILFWTAVHVGAHLFNVHWISLADPGAIHALVGDRLFGPTIPASPSQRWKAVFFHTRPGVTGIIITLCMSVAYPLVTYRRKRFESFWMSHHLLVVMLIALCVHGTGNILQNHQSLYWLSVPLVLYLVPRFCVCFSSSSTHVLSAKVVSDNTILSLRVSKPRNCNSSVHRSAIIICQLNVYMY